MSLAKAGITQDVIREMMPPYHLSADLLEGTFAALPPPPQDASATWRHARITRLVGEIAAFLPADAAQARLGAQIVVVRELADALTNRAYAPEVTVEQMCRLSRTSAELVRTAATLERALARRQQKPTPFFGTVVADGVDIAALDAVWCNAPRDKRPRASPMQQPATERRPGGEAVPAWAAPATQTDVIRPEPTPDQPDAALPVADPGRRPAVTSRPVPLGRTSTDLPAWRERLADAAPGIPVGTGSASPGAGIGAAAGQARDHVQQLHAT